MVLALLSTVAPARTITDGDTLKQGGITYRLWGIDAPEAKQVCADGWQLEYDQAAGAKRRRPCIVPYGAWRQTRCVFYRNSAAWNDVSRRVSVVYLAIKPAKESESA